MDLKEAHKLLDPNLDLRKTGTRTWLWAARFARAFIMKAPDWNDNGQANAYIATWLGRRDGDTFLTDLLPVPTPPSVWPYSGLWKDRHDYEMSVLKQRQERLARLIQEHQPALVMAYGQANYAALVSSLEGATRIAESSNLTWGRTGSSIVVLTPFWGTQFNSLTKVEAAEIVTTLSPILRF